MALEKSSFLARVLEPPSYGYIRDGRFYAPSKRELWAEFGSRMRFWDDRRNWLPFFSWFMTLILVVPLTAFLALHFSWPLFALGFVYSMVVLGTHGTIWFHRYGTHRAYRFKNPFFRTLCRNLVIRTIPEEIYIVSHHVHHWISEKPGDPYNVNGGWLYCFLADANHQAIRRDLSREEYRRLCQMMSHTGVRLNSYEQYLRWGSLCNPWVSIAHYAANWGFWYATFWWIGGQPLALALFGMAGVWAIGVRTFNYEGHGRGRDVRRDGVDFNRTDLSVNQLWPGYVSGEWHNNHHLYPNGARAGFLPYQLDLAWLFIKGCAQLGVVSAYRDYKMDFMRDHYLPWVRAQKEARESEPTRVVPAEL